MSNARRFGVVTESTLDDFVSKNFHGGDSFNHITLPEGFKFFKLPIDRKFILVDIVPFVTLDSAGNEILLPFAPYEVHRDIGPRHANVICPQRHKGEACPICEMLSRLDWNDPDDKAVGRSLARKRRQLCYLRWLDGPDDVKDNAYVFDSSEFAFGRLIREKVVSRNISDEEESGWDRYADPCEGYSLKLSLAKDKFNGKEFVKITSVDFKKRTQQYSEEFVTQFPDLCQSFKVYDYDKIKALYNAGRNVPTNTVASVGAGQESYPDPTDGYSPIKTSFDGNDTVDDDLPFA